MPYIKLSQREEVLNQGLDELVTYLQTVPIENRKGFVAYAAEYMAKYAFQQTYFGMSTGTDALRSAFVEMRKDLSSYEAKKRHENGEV